MEQSKPIRIESSLLDDAESERPKYFGTTTTWIAYLIRVGLNYHLGLDPCGRLGKPNDTERKKEKREVLPIPYIEDNRINKEKNKKWKFNINSLPESLDYCKDSIAKFWSVKAGTKSEDSYNLLVRELIKIDRQYGSQVIKNQLEEGIANRWQGITLTKYELYGRPKKDVTEQVTNHPAQNVFKASDIYGEV